MTNTVYERSPITALQAALDGGIEAGKLKVDQKVYIPFKLVTPDNISEFLSKN